MNFTNVNGVQYISIVDDRNRRGRPPKVRKDVTPVENVNDNEVIVGEQIYKQEIERDEREFVH